MGDYLFIEPFYGGSHKKFLDGLIEHSSFRIELLTLPARHWKWRMRGSAAYFCTSGKDFSIYEGIIVSNMLNLAEFRGLAGESLPPLILYFHENQILYPLKEGETEDLHYGFTDFTSALAADFILFNSRFHKEAFFSALPGFLRRFPDFRPEKSIGILQEKSSVLHPGCDLPDVTDRKVNGKDFPVILWNHRWEHDKNPEAFFRVLFELADEDIGFKLIVLGESYNHTPEIFRIAENKLKNHIIHFGYARDEDEYRRLLSYGDIVVSTAIQENFGISIIEAIASGCFPLLPDRLSYREIIPDQFHQYCIYQNDRDLGVKIRKLIARYDRKLMDKLAEENRRFSWSQAASRYDEFLEIIKKSRRPINPGTASE